MFNFFGLHLVDYTCVNGVAAPLARSRPLQARINTTVAWLGNLDVSRPGSLPKIRC